MTNANTIINSMLEDGFSLSQIKDALEDGAALAALGLTDDDQELIEEAHEHIRRVMSGECTESAKDTVARLTAWKHAAPNRAIEISWKWNGRDRSGLLKVLEGQNELTSTVFYRGSMHWGSDSDRSYTSCRTGSHKHLALHRVAKAVGA